MSGLAWFLVAQRWGDSGAPHFLLGLGFRAHGQILKPKTKRKGTLAPDLGMNFELNPEP